MPRAYVLSRRRAPKPIGDGICQLELSKGFVGLIDEADAEAVSVCNWCVSFNGKNPIPYVKGRPIAGSSRLVRLHRWLLGFPAMQIDHINQNTLDNRRCNLRICTQSENMANCGVRKNKQVKFKGVSLVGNFYVASCNAKVIGKFPSAIAAAKAYDLAAIKEFGEFARTNADLGLLDS